MDNELTHAEKTLLGFTLFCHCMRVGPTIFPAMQSIAEKCSVLKEFGFYAADFLSYSETVKSCQDANTTPFNKPASNEEH